MHYLSSLFWIYPKIYQSDVPRERFLEGIMIRCLKPQLDPFEVKKQYFYSELSPNVWSLYTIYLWGWAQPCCSEKSLWSLVSIISFVWSLLEAEGEGWSIDKVVNGKIFLPAPSSPQLFWYRPIHLLISSSILLSVSNNTTPRDTPSRGVAVHSPNPENCNLPFSGHHGLRRGSVDSHLQGKCWFEMENKTIMGLIKPKWLNCSTFLWWL